MPGGGGGASRGSHAQGGAHPASPSPLRLLPERRAHVVEGRFAAYMPHNTWPRRSSAASPAGPPPPSTSAAERKSTVATSCRLDPNHVCSDACSTPTTVLAERALCCVVSLLPPPLACSSEVFDATEAVTRMHERRQTARGQKKNAVRSGSSTSSGSSGQIELPCFFAQRPTARRMKRHHLRHHYCCACHRCRRARLT